MKTFKSYLIEIQESESFLFPEMEKEASQRKREATEKLKRLIAAQLRSQGHGSNVIGHIENLSHDELTRIVREVAGNIQEPSQKPPQPVQEPQQIANVVSDQTPKEINPHAYGYDPYANLSFDPTKLFTKET